MSTMAPLTTVAALDLVDVRFGYAPDQPVVTGVTADLPAGKVAALIGPNAAGKSTLLRLILGQAVPWNGRVSVCGRNVAGLPASQRAAMVSFVPQRGSIGFAFTVEQVVAMGRHALPADPAAVEQALQACDLPGLRQRIYAELSVGQQQRVLLARALAQARGAGRLMLLDEPVSAMDLFHIHHTMRLLVAQARSGLAVLIVLHDLNLAARYADVVWLMDDGHLVAAGAWNQVLRPEVLEPVYRVHLRALAGQPDRRPVFLIDDPDTL